MSATSWRTAALPPHWPALRRSVLERDGHRCTWADALGRCTQTATEVDHTQGPNDHRPEVLRSLCGWHHRRVTSKQALAARALLPRMVRPDERHPGLA